MRLPIAAVAIAVLALPASASAGTVASKAPSSCSATTRGWGPGSS